MLLRIHSPGPDASIAGAALCSVMAVRIADPERVDKTLRFELAVVLFDLDPLRTDETPAGELVEARGGSGPGLDAELAAGIVGSDSAELTDTGVR